MDTMYRIPYASNNILEVSGNDSLGLGGKILEYSPRAGVYYIRTASRVVSTVELENSKDLNRYLVEDYKSFFPNFNSDTHYCDLYTYEGFKPVVVLKEYYTVPPEKLCPLKPAIYKFDSTPDGIAIAPVLGVSADRQVKLSTTFNGVEDDIEAFFKNEKMYSDMGMRYRRGCLIYGSPGNGKTLSILKSLEKLLTSNKDTLAFLITENIRSIDFIAEFRPLFINKKVIFIIEEITEKLKHGAEPYLSFLDGELSWNNCYTISTTNYPEELEPNIVDRPGRFDLLLEVPPPDDTDRRTYLTTILGGDITPEDIKTTEGFSVAYLKELCLQHKITGKSISSIVKEMRARKKRITNNFKVASKKMGIKEEDFSDE